MNSIQIAFSFFGFWLSIVGPIAALVWNIRNESFRLWKENQERWIECNLRIEKILAKMEANK